MTPLLCDDKITLRAVEATDLDSILAWENDTTIREVGSSILTEIDMGLHREL